jgi:hypothetical protein
MNRTRYRLILIAHFALELRLTSECDFDAGKLSAASRQEIASRPLMPQNLAKGK